MAAINAAGYDADLASPNNAQLRNDIRAEVAKRNPASLPALKEFFAKHRKRSDSAELSQYISFALASDGPPTFAIKRKEEDVPVDAAGIRDFAPLLARFYKEAEIEDLWKRSQRAVDQFVARYHTGVSENVLAVNSYLRQQTSGFRGRRFQILVEMLAAPNQAQTRSFDDQYTIILTPSPEPRIFDVRHGYLHYLLDPLALRHREVLERKKAVGDHAARAPALPDSHKDDFLQLATESLIKAIEARLDKKPEAVQQSLRQGYVLAPYFAEQLPVYEAQEQALALFYPATIAGIDLYKEEKRLAGVEFVREVSTKSIPVPAAPEPALTGAAKTLDDAERLYLARDLEPAKKLYLAVIQETDQRPAHSEAYYGLARIALLQRDPETADRLFRKSLELEPGAQVKAWDLVYLGKLSLAAGERGPAAGFFEGALQVEGASEKAKEEARKGLQQTKQ